MHLKQRLRTWMARFWDSQVDAINDAMAEIDIKPVVIRNKLDLWIAWAKIAGGAFVVAALFYLALTHGGGAP